MLHRELPKDQWLKPEEVSWSPSIDDRCTTADRAVGHAVPHTDHRVRDQGGRGEGDVGHDVGGEAEEEVVESDRGMYWIAYGAVALIRLDSTALQIRPLAQLRCAVGRSCT